MHEHLRAAVGPHKPNHASDVRLVQTLLGQFSFVTHKPLRPDGHWGPSTQSAIFAFQRQVMHMERPTGAVEVMGLTYRRLQRLDIANLCAVPPWLSGGAQGKASVPSKMELSAAATTLGCEAGVIAAIEANETGSRTGFDEQGRPTILFERHIFARETDGIYNKDYPTISNPKQGGYGHFSEQYGKIERAYALDEEAALLSASWGAFQIMGFNYDMCGYGSVEAFVAAMTASVSNHLGAFVKFVQASPALKRDMQAKNWPGLARYYNGPDFAKNAYDQKLAAAYKSFEGQ